MIKVLQVINSMDCGGAENFIMNLYRDIDTSKIQFDFLVHTNKKCFFDDKIKKLGGNIYHLPHYKIYNFFSYKKTLKKFFKDHPNYDIVHGHIGSCSHIYLNQAKKANCFTIAHCHSAKPDKITLRNRLYLFFSWKTRHVADFFFGCSKEAGNWRYGNKISTDGSKFKIINNGIETSKYKFNSATRNKVSKEFNINDKEIVIGHVGSFYPVKNHKFIIEILEEALKINPNTKLMLIGDGMLHNNIVEQIKNKKLEDKVILTGLRNDVADLLQRIDCFIFPSLYEGLPVSLVEAQAASLPCLISDVITKEVALTPLVEHYPLDNNARNWAIKALKMAKTKRDEKYNDEVSKTYDIQTVASEIIKFYTSKAK